MFSSSYDDIDTRVTKTVKAQEDESNVEAEMADLMARNSGQSKSDFAGTLYNYLTDRYDTKWWFVTVYNPVSGYDKHCNIGRWHYVFRVGNKNAGAISYPIKSEGIWDLDSDTKRALSQFAASPYCNGLFVLDGTDWASNLAEQLPSNTNRYVFHESSTDFYFRTNFFYIRSQSFTCLDYFNNFYNAEYYLIALP